MSIFNIKPKSKRQETSRQSLSLDDEFRLVQEYIYWRADNAFVQSIFKPASALRASPAMLRELIRDQYEMLANPDNLPPFFHQVEDVKYQAELFTSDLFIETSYFVTDDIVFREERLAKGRFSIGRSNSPGMDSKPYKEMRQFRPTYWAVEMNVRLENGKTLVVDQMQRAVKDLFVNSESNYPDDVHDDREILRRAFLRCHAEAACLTTEWSFYLMSLGNNWLEY